MATSGNGTGALNGKGPVHLTGGSGFIGGAVLRKLNEAGRDVIVLDVNEPSEPCREFRKLDVRDLDACVAALHDAQHVVHLAGLVAEPANKHPLNAVSINVLGTGNMLEACVRNNIPKIVLASTFIVYENCGLDEVDDTTKLDFTGMNTFGRSKYMCEQLAADYSKKHDLKVISLRFGSVYGPGPGSNVIREFVEQAVRGDEIVVWGKGARHRQFVYVDDVADSVVHAIQADASGIFSIAGDAQTTTRQVLDLIREAIPTLKAIYDETKPERVQAYRIDLRNAESGLGWKPVTPIDEGIRRTIEWYRASVTTPSASAAS